MYIYVARYKTKWKDERVLFFIFGIVNSLYVFIHYGVIPAINRGKVYFLIELFRFLALSLVCFYYTTKASGLIPKQSRKIILKVSRVVLLMSVPIYVAIIIVV